MELIEKIRTLSKQLNAELLVTHCTDYYDFFNLHSKSDNIDDWLGIELENRKFHHIDLYQAFRNKKVPVEKIMQENWTAHFLPKGHEYIAEVLYEEIQSPKWRLPE